tara:strand:+ start:1187 stop:1540 length:354 start_codon:yes stop_codon:yes gene_type:complete
MYSSVSCVDNRINYKNLTYDSRKKQNNYKILNENNIDNKIGIEIEFTKNNSLFIKKIFINKCNLDKIIKKLIKNGFICASQTNDIDVTCHEHKTECNTGIHDFIRDGYNNSFQQKYT